MEYMENQTGQKGEEIGYEEEETTDQQISDIRNKLKKVFTFYTSFGDRFNSTMLKSNKFHKMMNDAGIRDNYVTKKRLDLLFCKANKH